jgi:hypothetical protein
VGSSDLLDGTKYNKNSREFFPKKVFRFSFTFFAFFFCNL